MSMYAYVQDVAADWEMYRSVARILGDNPPEGIVLRVAGATDTGFRVIEVWESRAAWEDFRTSQLRPALRALGGDAPDRPPMFADLVVDHVIINEKLFGSVSLPQ